MDKLIEKLLSNKKVIIIVSLLLIASLVFYGIIKVNSRNFNDKKIDKTKYIVYTKETRNKEYYIQDIPVINLKGETINVINNDIETYLEEFNKENIEISYEYNINGIVLSLVLKVEDHSLADKATITNFRSYNIKMNSLELLSNYSVLSYFNITEEEVSKVIENDLKNYYEELVNNKNINRNECNYECFISNRDISSNYLKDTNYYIRDGKLIVFKPTTFIPLYEKEERIDEFEIV